MNDRLETNLQQINDLWGLHEYWDQSCGVETTCLAFAIDRRYLTCEFCELRLGVSFGGNPFTKEIFPAFVPPPIFPGKYVFGIHLIGTKGDKLTLYDRWYDGRPAEEFENPNLEKAFARAEEILQNIADPDYRRAVEDRPRQEGSLGVSDRYRLEDFQVMTGEAF